MKYLLPLLLAIAVHAAPPIGFMQPDSLQSGLVNWWTMNEGSGTNASDTLTKISLTNSTASAVGWTNGAIGSAASFNNNGYGYNGTLTLTAFTISAWLRSGTNDASNDRYALHIGVSSAGSDYLPLIGLMNGNKWAFYFTGFSFTAGSTNIAGNWTHIVFTSAGTVQSLYTNSVYAGGTTISASPTSKPFTIGMLRGLAGSRWIGSIDEVRIYNRVLTAAEIKQLYGAGYGSHQ